jgi:hypothetical protein
MQRRSFDFVLIGLVLIFTFLASSFAVRNSDFWLHLASGRLLAEGRYQFGVDPFAFTTANHYWVNHAWLFDLPLYLLYAHLGEQLGGVVLVVLKALFVSFMALVLLYIRRPEGRLGWPAACVLLAVLAMSPRLLLHSTLTSYVLLALTLWLLRRPLQANASFRRQVGHYAPLLLLFVLWVNVDSWFLLGPLLAALFWLGERLQIRSASEETRRTPGWLWPTGLALCLINPHHLHAFTLPAELTPLPEALRHDLRFAQLYTSPWQINLYVIYTPLSGINLARAAYLVLLALGALSFLLNVRNLLGWRLLVWLAFAGLSAWSVQAIPFFAIVAAPLTALNLQDAFSLGRMGRSRWLCGISYSILVISALVLIGLAWPGWLQGFQDRGRHVDWSVQPDGSLRHVAEKLRLWRRQGKLGEGRGFLYHPSLVHYCAYFCPEEKGFLDLRLPLFHEVADSYEEICQALNPTFAAAESKTPLGWRSTLRTWGITHLVLYDPVAGRLLPTLMQLADENSPWTLLDVDGQALIIGWRDGDRSLPSDVPPLDAERLAFTVAGADQHEAMLAEAPGRGPQRGPRPADFWSYFGKAIPPSPWQTEAAGMLLDYFGLRIPYEVHKQDTRNWLTWAAALPAQAVLPSGSLDSLWRLAVHIGLPPPNWPDRGQQSPALPLLAIRAARQALADNPDDADAYLYLGLAYLTLVRQTPENAVIGRLRPLAELRHIQIATALENALRRDPNSLNALHAHEELAILYEGRYPPFLKTPFLDAALDHRRAALQLARRIGPGPGENVEAFARRLEKSESNIRDLQRLVSDRKNEFVLQTRNLGSEPYRKAETALRMGLARLALEEVLMPASIVLLGGEGTRLQVWLQLMLGQVDLVREQLQSEDWKANKEKLGVMTLEMSGNADVPVYYLPAYEWLLLCQRATDGDYEEAETLLKEQLRLLSPQLLGATGDQLRSQLAETIRRELYMSALPQGPQGLARRLLHQLRLETTELLRHFLETMQERAKLRLMFEALAGMLELEHGRPEEARKAFRQARTISRQGTGPLARDPSASLAETYLRMLALPSRNKR